MAKKRILITVLNKIPVLWIRIGFNTDPDPAFYLTADPDPDPGSQIQCCGTGTGTVGTVTF
jgi:hypothetical protein